MGIPNHLNRSWTKRAAALTAIAGAAFYGIAAGTAQAAPSTAGITMTAVSPHHVAATTANQVITVTGTNFDEDVITDVAIAGCTSPMYIVQSPTTLLIKTDATCAKADLAAITITDASGTTATVPATGGKTELDFVDAPTIKTPSATVRPVLAENSVGAAYANQAHAGSTSGGTVVRVWAGATVFATSSSYPLAASLAGVPLTSIKMATDGTYFTGVLGAHAALATPVLRITSNGVSKNFTEASGTTAGTHDFAYAGTTISVAPTSGGLVGGGTLTITGAGFSASTTVTVGSNSCAVIGTPTATKLSCTIPASTSDAVGPVKVVTASPASVVSAGSIYTYLDA